MSEDPIDDGLLDAIRLAQAEGVGPVTYQSLVTRFGQATAVFEASPSDLRSVPGVGPKILTGILAAPSRESVAAEIIKWRERGVRTLAQGTGDYPVDLAKIPDPPVAMFLRGTLEPRDALAVAIVGTRHASPYGLRTAERLANGLSSAGFTVISGLARGIDTSAHRGALQAGGRTLAIMGSGVLNVYPPENVKLAEEIIARGGLLSESLPEAAPLGHTFPQRNRIISGMSLGVVVVEADRNSGALISARHAMEQGREVFAVPGPIDSPGSHGCHRLIRDGAKLVECVEDILEELGPLSEPVKSESQPEIRNPAELQLNEPESTVLRCVAVEATGIDDVIVASGLPTPRVLAILSVLEMKRLIRRLGGNRVMRL